MCSSWQADHLYRMDYATMAEFHWKNQADITVAVTPHRRPGSASLWFVEAQSRPADTVILSKNRAIPRC